MKKGKTIKNKTRQQKVTRKKRPKVSAAPPKLLEIIKVVNLIPSDLVMEDFSVDVENEIYYRKRELAKEEAVELAKRDKFQFHWNYDSWDYNSFVEDTIQDLMRSPSMFRPNIDEDEIRWEFLVEHMENMPNDLVEWIEEPLHEGNEPYLEAMERYHSALEWRETFLPIVEWLTKKQKENQEKPWERYYTIPFPTKGWLTVSDNKLKVRFSEIFEIIESIDARRLRICPNCKKIFWADRLDMKGCSTACAKVLRTRTWREKTTEEQRTRYKINRIKKELKKEKEKKNGTL